MAAGKQRLKCECINCTYTQGRVQSTYVYPVDFNSNPAGRAAYNAAESAAMKEADQAAVAAAAAALNNAPACPQTCERRPFWQVTHGPPFAGGTGGNGIARSLWKVTYSCVKPAVLVMVPSQPQTAPQPEPPCVVCAVSATPLPPQACTGPNCGSGGAACRGPDGDARILQLTSDLRTSLPGNQQLLSDFDRAEAGIVGGDYRYRSVDIDHYAMVEHLTDASRQLVSALSVQGQRIAELNGLTSLMPCTAGGPPPAPPPQPTGSAVPALPGGFSFGFGVGGGHEERGGEDRGRGGGEDRGSRGGTSGGTGGPGYR